MFGFLRHTFKYLQRSEIATPNSLILSVKTKLTFTGCCHWKNSTWSQRREVKVQGFPMKRFSYLLRFWSELNLLCFVTICLKKWGSRLQGAQNITQAYYTVYKLESLNEVVSPFGTSGYHQKTIVDLHIDCFIDRHCLQCISLTRVTRYV